MTAFLSALGLLLVIEGVLYAGVPSAMRRMAGDVSRAPEATLRIAGLGAAFLGILVLWAVRG